MKEITFDRFVRMLGVVIILIVMYLLINKLSAILMPFLVAWFIAYLLYPIVCFFQYRCHLHFRVVAIIVTLLLVCGGITVAGLFIIPPMIDEFVRVQDVITQYLSTQAVHSDLPHLIEEYAGKYLRHQDLSKLVTFNDIAVLFEKRVPQLLSFISSSFNTLLGVIASLIAVIYMFFILMDYEQMSDGVIRLIPQKHRHFVSGMLNDVKVGMNSYFRGQSLIAFCVGILFAIGFTIIGFPLAIPLGLFIGILNLVPYLQVVGFVPTVILALLKSYDTGEGFWGILLSALIVFCVVQAIQDWILTPRIMGHVMGLNGAIILLSLSVWGTLLGFIGLIIALPLTTLIFSYYKRFVLHERGSLLSDITENETQKDETESNQTKK